MRVRPQILEDGDPRLVRRGESQDEFDKRMSTRGPAEPTITALWAALVALQQDVQELQREVFDQGEDG